MMRYKFVGEYKIVSVGLLWYDIKYHESLFTYMKGSILWGKT